MNAVLKYPGAKNRLAPWIIEYIPEHDVYLEPFFGSGGVFFNKKPATIETLNDLNSDVTNYFKVLREYPEKLIYLLELTPFGREEYNNSYIQEECSDIEKARRFAVQCFMGYGCSNNYKNGFRSSQQGHSPRTTKAWNKLPETLRLATIRLKDAQIENLPAVELIKRYNTKDVFIYADPPYLHSTRKGYLYKHEMTDEQHIELLETLLEHPGKVLLSGYDNKLYNKMLLNWNKVYKNTTAEAGLKRTEVLWMNYNTSQIRMEI